VTRRVSFVTNATVTNTGKGIYLHHLYCTTLIIIIIIIRFIKHLWPWLQRRWQRSVICVNQKLYGKSTQGTPVWITQF